MNPSADQLEALAELYSEADALIAESSPRCEASGRCCRFTEYGHTLFLSELEAEQLLAPGLPAGSRVSRDACPFQIGGLCTARERRPLGCRTYFCDPAYADQMPLVSEQLIRRLKDLHDRLGLGWNYRPLHHFLEGRRTDDLDPSPQLPIVDLS